MKRPRRIAITGSECTGKTTLAADLARHFSAHWVPEQSRLYAERAARPLSAADVEPIAHAQLAAEDAALLAAARSGDALLILDTDLLSTVVYARHYYGHCPAWIVGEARARRADLYLLCDTDITWTADLVRDRPHARTELHSAFRRMLTEFGATSCLVSGLGPNRLDAALRCISECPALSRPDPE